MKKLIAISVMLALIVGAVFAETQVSGGVETRLSVNGSNGKDGNGDAIPARIGGSIGTAYLELSGQNEEGTLGATFRLRNEDIVRSTTYTDYSGGTNPGGLSDTDDQGRATFTIPSNAWFHKAFVWWKPIEQVKIFLGIEQDGLFDTADLEGWFYHQGGEDFLNNHDWDYWRTIFPGNWDAFGLAISIYPVDGLDINVIVPLGGRNWPQATKDQTEREWRADEMFIDGLRLQVNYAIQGIGKIHLTWMGPNDVAGTGLGAVTDYAPSTDYEGKKHDKSGYKTKGMFGASFLLTAVDGLQANVGFSTAIANTDTLGDSAKSPLNLGFGAAYSHESGFGVKARGAYLMNVGFADKTTQFFISVKPSYNFGSATVFCDIGFVFDDYDNKAKFGDDTAVPYWINPYVAVPISGGVFKAGLKIDGTGKTKNVDDVVKWSIPMLLSFGF